MSVLSAVVDACVLYSAPIRDTLLRSAEQGLYRVLWSESILEEVRRSLVEQRRVRPEQAQRLVDMLRHGLPEAMVSGYELRIPAMGNNPKDRHVLAAAVEAGAQIVVTSNLRDFPEAALRPWGIEAQSPDEFLTGLFNDDPAELTQIVIDQARDLRKPAKTVYEVLDAIALQAPGFAQLVRAHLDHPPAP